MLSTAACLQMAAPPVPHHPSCSLAPLLLQILAANVEDVGPDVIEAVSQLEPAVRLAAWCGS